MIHDDEDFWWNTTTEAHLYSEDSINAFKSYKKLENSIPRREDPTETTEQTSTTHETEKNTPETRTDTNTDHVDPSTEETSTVEAHNETPLTSILQNQIDMQEKINNLTTKRSMDPTMAAIIQSLT